MCVYVCKRVCVSVSVCVHSAHTYVRRCKTCGVHIIIVLLCACTHENTCNSGRKTSIANSWMCLGLGKWWLHKEVLNR